MAWWGEKEGGGWFWADWAGIVGWYQQFCPVHKRDLFNLLLHQVFQSRGTIHSTIVYDYCVRLIWKSGALVLSMRVPFAAAVRHSYSRLLQVCWFFQISVKQGLELDWVGVPPHFKVVACYKLGNRHTLCRRFGQGIACVGPFGCRNQPTIEGFRVFGWS